MHRTLSISSSKSANSSAPRSSNLRRRASRPPLNVFSSAVVASASSSSLLSSPRHSAPRSSALAARGAAAAAAPSAFSSAGAEPAQPLQRRPRAAGPSPRGGSRLRGPSLLDSSGTFNTREVFYHRKRIQAQAPESNNSETTMVQQLEAASAAAAARTVTTTAAKPLPTPPPSSPSSSFAPLPPRQPSGVPVYVMLPLDTVDGEGRFRYGVVSPSPPTSSAAAAAAGDNGNGNNEAATTSTSSAAVTPWFSRALREIAAAGAHGVAVDVWWGAVERFPKSYDFSGYRALAAAVRAAGLRLQVVLSFHACGGNVGDDAAIPLPSWVEEAALGDADLLYADAPRGGALGRRNPECVSLFADGDEGALGGRSPLRCYRDFMEAFRAEFGQELGIGKKRRKEGKSSSKSAAIGSSGGVGGGVESKEEGEEEQTEPSPLFAVIDEVVVGAGPCGELRYPSYFEPHGWRFPGVGEFQCHDRRARASLAEAARKVGRPEWGYAGPHDAGTYNDAPDATGFFAGWGGAWDSEYGKFFINWYAGELLAHGERLADAAVSVFGLAEEGEEEEEDEEEEMMEGGDGAAAAAAKAAVSLPSSTTTAFPLPPLRREARSTSLASMDSDVGGGANGGGGFGNGKGSSAALAAAAAAATAAAATSGGGLLGRGPPPAWDRAVLPARPQGLSVALKVAGVHWWYRHPSHAAELTAGYSNARSSGESYDAIVALCAAANLGLTLTCVEMCDGQHPPEALCGPEGLLRQVREAAAAQGVPLGGENALPVFGPGHADGRALARVAYNTDAWAPPLQEAARARDELYGSLTQGNDGMNAEGGGNAGGAEMGGGGDGGGGDGGRGSPPPSPARAAAAAAQQQQPSSSSPPPLSSSATPPTTPPSPSTLPPMRSFTFLRLTPSMLEPPISDEWRAFLRRMRAGGGGGGNGGGNGANGASALTESDVAAAAAATGGAGGGAMIS